MSLCKGTLFVSLLLVVLPCPTWPMLLEVSGEIVAVIFSVEVTREMMYLFVRGGRVILLISPEQLPSSRRTSRTERITILSFLQRAPDRIWRQSDRYRGCTPCC